MLPLILCSIFWNRHSKTQNFDKQYRFMSDAEAEEEFKHLVDQPVKGEIPALLQPKTKCYLCGARKFHVQRP
jgi:hypothetical protein